MAEQTEKAEARKRLPRDLPEDITVLYEDDHQAPDIERIKALAAFDVGQRLGIIHQDVPKPDPQRYAFDGCNTSTWLQFYRDGGYFDHKRGVGGSCIDLVMQWLDRPSFEVDQKRFKEAARTIAAAFGLWVDFEPVRRKGKKLVGDDPVRAAKGELNAEAQEFFKAIGVPRQTFAVSAAGLCWQPAVPWQGKAHHTKDGRPFGGWTREVAEEWLDHPDALRLYVLDFDGCKTEDGEQIPPRPENMISLVHELGRRGLTPRATVFSSWDGERVKSHLYFVARSRARDEDEFLAWHRHLDTAVGQAVANWNLVHPEKRTFVRDEATRQITRLMRVPGYAKPGSEHAAVLYDTNPSATVDFRDLLETQEIRFSVGENEYRFGAGTCFLQYTKDDETKTIAFARDVWPLEIYEHVDRGEYGVRFRYVSLTGRTCYGTAPASGFADKSYAKKVAGDLAERGVNILAGRGTETVLSLSSWKDAAPRTTSKLVSTPGWHGSKVYVNGESIFGARGWRADVEREQIRFRSGRAGTLDGWCKAVRELGTTYGLAIAIGQSLAGALVEPFDVEPFTIHIHGPSSCGKSSAARFAASVWGDPRDLFQSWNTTSNAFEGLAETASGACLILDEIQRWRHSPEALGNAIHDINSSKGRSRLNSNSDMRRQRTWKLTALSTGEVSIEDRLGASFQGGHAVRGMDLRVAPGDITTDQVHAGMIQSITMRQHGHVGDAWIHYLTHSHPHELMDSWKFWREKLELSEVAEELRIMGNLAVVATALEHAREAGLLPWDDDEIFSVMKWLILAVMPEREGRATPDERALDRLRRWVDTQPERFPSENEPERGRNVIGYLQREAHVMQLWTSESMINESQLPVQAGVSVRSWLQWCVEAGHARKASNERCAGRQRNWYVFRIDE